MDYATQSRCPYCFSSEGYVRRVTFNAGARVFTFTCADCHHMWCGEPHACEDGSLAPASAGREQPHLHPLRSRPKPLSV